MNRESRAGMEIDAAFLAFVEGELAPITGRHATQIWDDFRTLHDEFQIRNDKVLNIRGFMQSALDDWFHDNPEASQAEYTKFLREIGYITAEGGDFTVDVDGIDDEVARLAGPQLVVPVMNGRFALNAANARWGSLYDALYGTNALADPLAGRGLDQGRVTLVRDYVRDHLDRIAPLLDGSWRDVAGLVVRAGALVLAGAGGLADAGQFAGYIGAPEAPGAIILRVNGLHIRLVIDRASPTAQNDPAGIADVIVEAALSTIMDCEDSVAAVDGEDKALVYRNWLGLMTGELSEAINKGGRVSTRRLNDDIAYTRPDGVPARLKGRSLMFVRNVGHLMTNPAILINGEEVYEGVMDAYFTTLAATVNGDRDRQMANSAYGSIYIVKPKMHGPDEVALANDLFARVETLLDLPANTIKMGIMDEERRTSVNLRECIRAAKSRVCFINTGFLDRTGDEIHTHMQKGIMVPKARMKAASWYDAYEDRNVRIGLDCGLGGRAQIGKGMWAKLDDMRGMLAEKIGHPQSGATTAWVPSPTGAAIHALHYHLVDVGAVQTRLIAARGNDDRLDDLVIPPILAEKPDSATITAELENNLQGILGYVVRWVNQGMGASRVPDINDVPLMEDRATCRISAQMIANWLEHGLIDAEMVDAAMIRIAEVVNRQNTGAPSYVPLAPGTIAYQAARELAVAGKSAPSGYTEPTLHKARAAFKQSLNEN